MTGPSQRALYECACGAVQADILVPSSMVKPLAITCCCRDCVGFTQGVIEASNSKYENSTDSPNVEAKHLVSDGLGSVNYVILRSSSVTPVKGQEHIKACKVKPDTKTTRLYASCCGTPLGWNTSLSGIHPELLKSHPDKVKGQVDMKSETIKPTICFFRESAPEGAAPIPEGVKVSTGFPFGFATKYMTFAAGGLFRKKTTGLLEGREVEPTIGIDTISLEK